MKKMVNEIDKDRFSGIREKAHDGVDKIMDKAKGISEKGEEGIEHIKEKATMMREDVSGYVRCNPEKSLLIAAGVGAVIGALLAAAIMRRKD